MVRSQRFEDLIIWQLSASLYLQVHQLRKFNKEFFVNDQILRAALSISNNIAEGFERSSINEYAHFLSIAKGSCGEVRSLLLILKFTASHDQNVLDELIQNCIVISVKISNLLAVLRKGA